MIFLEAEFQGRFVDWEPAARTDVGFVRAATPYEPRLANLIGELSLWDTEFRTWWAERHVNYATSASRTYTHPLTGPYALDWQALRPPDDSQLLIVWTAPPHSHSLDILHKLNPDLAPRPSQAPVPALLGRRRHPRPANDWRAAAAPITQVRAQLPRFCRRRVADHIGGSRTLTAASYRDAA